MRDVKEDQPLRWDEYHDKQPAEALEGLYKRVTARSKQRRDWYWRSIGLKRTMSFGSRWLSYLLGVGGVSAPLVSALFGSAETRLFWTQLGVVALAVAGLVQLGDRVFGFSSGWMRYVTTVTAMERLAGSFQLDWAQFFLTRDPGAVTQDDTEALFVVAKKFDEDTRALQDQETNSWVSEFNSGMATLDEMLRLQKEAAEKERDDVIALGAIAVREARPGAVELVVTQTDVTAELTISLAGIVEETFVGSSWAATLVPPGIHALSLRRSSDGHTERRTVVIRPDEVARIELTLP